MFFKLVLMEELARAGAPFGPLARMLADRRRDHRVRQRAPAARGAAAIARGEATFWQGYSEPGAGLRPARAQDRGAARRRSLRDPRPQDLVEPRRHLALRARVRAHEPGDAPQPRVQHVRGAERDAGHGHPSDQEPDRRGLSLRGVPRRRARARRSHARSRGRGVRGAAERARLRPVLGPLLQGARARARAAASSWSYANATTVGRRPLAADPGVRRRLARMATEIAALRLMFYRAACLIRDGAPDHLRDRGRQGHGGRDGAALRAARHGSARPLGTRSARARRWRSSAARCRTSYLTSLGHTIAGGTAEILRTTVAVRGLGLPAEPRRLTRWTFVPRPRSSCSSRRRDSSCAARCPIELCSGWPSTSAGSTRPSGGPWRSWAGSACSCRPSSAAAAARCSTSCCWSRRWGARACPARSSRARSPPPRRWPPPRARRQPSGSSPPWPTASASPRWRWSRSAPRSIPTRSRSRARCPAGSPARSSSSRTRTSRRI